MILKTGPEDVIHTLLAFLCIWIARILKCFFGTLNKSILSGIKIFTMLKLKEDLMQFLSL